LKIAKFQILAGRFLAVFNCKSTNFQQLENDSHNHQNARSTRHTFITESTRHNAVIHNG